MTHKIIRDGKEIILTQQEVNTIIENEEFDNYEADVRSCAEDRFDDVELSDEDVSFIASTISNKLSKSDPYFEAYWETIKQAIVDFGGEQ